MHYTLAAHEHPSGATCSSRRAAELPVARAWAREELSLPMFPALEPDEVELVIEACHDWALQVGVPVAMAD